jgi:hypothetical protein
MSADEHLSKPQFFHGMPHEAAGDLVHPTNQGFAHQAFFTSDPKLAEGFTMPKNYWGDSREKNTGYVYPVQPTGDYRPDHQEDNSFKTESPLKITGPGRPVQNTWKVHS